MNKEKICIIVSEYLKCSIEDENLSQDIRLFENWSSLTHLFIISDLEQEFNIQFDVDEIENIETINDYIMAIENKLNQ